MQRYAESVAKLTQGEESNKRRSGSDSYTYCMSQRAVSRLERETITDVAEPMASIQQAAPFDNNL